MTPYAVSQMSDEEISELLNERWRTIILLLKAAGGRLEISDYDIVETDFEHATMETWRDPATNKTIVLLGRMC